MRCGALVSWQSTVAEYLVWKNCSPTSWVILAAYICRQHILYIHQKSLTIIVEIALLIFDCYDKDKLRGNLSFNYLLCRGEDDEDGNPTGKTYLLTYFLYER